MRTSSVQTTSEAPQKLLLQRIKKLRTENSRLRRRQCRKNGYRRITALRNVNVSNLSADLSDFVKNQLRNADRVPAGRRYTDNFLKTCLIVYHHSRRCYRALRQIFVMPSPRWLLRKMEHFFEKVRRIYACSKIIHIGYTCTCIFMYMY